MKYVLVLIFVETGVLPMAIYENYVDCKVDALELEGQQMQHVENNSDLLAKLSMSTATYQCLPAPKSYDLSDK